MVTLAAAGFDVENRLLVVLVQLCIIIAAARIFATLFRRIHQPAVMGEIAAGIILGPSLLGWLFPGLFALIFPASTSEIGRDSAVALQVISQIGLIFLLFLVGLEFDFSHLKRNARSAIGISFAGIVLPMSLGIALAHYLYEHLGSGIEERGFTFFLGVALSITALPVLARMMQEFRITRTRLGTITITAAAIDDAVGWILLATVTAMVTAHFDMFVTLRMIALTIGFALFLIFVAGPVLRKWARRAVSNEHGMLDPNSLAIVLVVLFLCAVATSLIGIFAIFGAFLLGAVLSSMVEFRRAIADIMHEIVNVFFLPIFFTYTGLRTNVGLLETPQLWMFAAIVWIAAIAGKFGGCTIAARLSGFSTRESMLVGSMMNTRGLMELIVLNVGYELGVIPPTLFTMLVLMALITTIMTTPLLRAFMKNTELEPHLAPWFSKTLKATTKTQSHKVH